MKLRFVTLLVFALTFTLHAQENFTYLFNVGLNTISQASDKTQKDAAKKTLLQVLPANISVSEQEGIYSISTSTDNINPVELEASLKNLGITLTYFEKKQYDSDDQLVFTLYYKPPPRDPSRIKK